MVTDNSPIAYEIERQFQNSFGNQAVGNDKRPTLTLGLKKRLERHDHSQRTKEHSRMTLGLRKKASVNQHEEGNQTATTQRSKLTIGLNKKHEFRPPVEFSQKMSKPNHSAISMPKTQGKLEVNIKINELPNWVESIKNGRQEFCINVDGQIVRMKVRHKTWQKLLKANEKYSEWVASITGKMGHRVRNGFELLEPAIQIHEKES